MNTDGLRTVRSFLPDGNELGVLEATGKWSLQKHPLHIRRTINHPKQRKLLYFTQFDNPIDHYNRYLEEKAKEDKRSRNKMAQQRQQIRKAAECVKLQHASESVVESKSELDLSKEAGPASVVPLRPARNTKQSDQTKIIF
ncbi:hypothetical protein [Ectobacillus panaciterrae]|uniref:hypothetical protein n=1 Tax=Ectobacillus panaciterrae TaxID=363872 RepID=UPI000404A6FD|nr:hypothetical protein [Ectobacillus panaciterrae]